MKALEIVGVAVGVFIGFWLGVFAFVLLLWTLMLAGDALGIAA